jgi:chemotaxis protein MotB
MKRNHTVAHENHERWLVSYADFITLLFAFFVVMFASTQADKKKAAEVSAAVRDALEHGQLSNTLAAVLGRGKHEAARQPLSAQHVDKSENLPPPAAPPHPADLAKSLASLEKSLATEIASGKIDVSLERRGLVISLRESALFASGDDAIAPGSLPAILKIAREIRGLPNPMRLEGHTDSVPIHNSRFRSNWELSAARAIAVMELLRQRFDIPSQRMSVAGYAENAPADTDDTPTGRAHNRRVDLVVLSAEAELNEPKRAKDNHSP